MARKEIYRIERVSGGFMFLKIPGIRKWFQVSSMKCKSQAISLSEPLSNLNTGKMKRGPVNVELNIEGKPMDFTIPMGAEIHFEDKT